MNANHAEPAIVNQLEKLIVKSKGRVTTGDLATETAQPLHKIKDALARLLEIYQAQVTMDSDTGDLLFNFGFPLKKKGSKSFKEQMQTFGSWLWNIFKKVYKAIIGIVLIVYAIIFALLLIFIMLRGGDDDRDGNGFGNLIGGIFQAIFQAMSFAAWHSAITYDIDDSGHRYRTYQRDKNKGKNFIQSIFSFVFGPERPKFSPLADAKEAASFIKDNNGKITAGHIIALSGVNYMEAEIRLADYAVRFKGELEIDNSGTVVGYFREIMNTVSTELKGGKIIFYPDEVEAPYQLTGNKTGTNLLVIIINIFNLIMSGIILNALNHIGIDNAWITFFLGIFPFIFSGLFFLVPLLRIPYLYYKRNKREQNIIRQDIMRSILIAPSSAFTKEELLKYVDQKKKNAAEQILSNLIIELNGDISISEEGQAIYRFDRLAKELSIS